MRKIVNSIFVFIFTLTMISLSGCSDSLPDTYSISSKAIDMYPDYQGVTVPCNIAPLNFAVLTECDDAVAMFSANGKNVIKRAQEKAICLNKEEWQTLISNSKGKISVALYLEKDSKWSQHPSFDINVVNDSIDRFLTYRSIEPLYRQIGQMGVFQFDLENGMETDILDAHKLKSANKCDAFCMNCHTSQKANPNNKLLHVRGVKSGMMITYNGKTKIVDAKCGDMANGAGYSQWHPKLPFIAFQSETVRQHFTSGESTKNYPFDIVSDLLLYDIEKNEVSNILRTKNKVETFMSWSPDGEYLYYATTDSIYKSAKDVDKIHFDIARIKFDASTKTFGSPEIMVNASKSDSSASGAKISPDGKYMLYRRAKYGSYMQTAKSADIFIMDLSTRESHALNEINSKDADSFHDWSSNGRWIMVESRRLDGNYARVFFAYFDKNGVAHKPFQLPRQNPWYDYYSMKCYNCSEFSTTPAEKQSFEIFDFMESNDIEKASFVSTIDSADANSGATKVDAQSGASQLNKKTKK